MNANSIPLAYGYQELRLFQHRTMALAMAISIAFQMTILGVYHLTGWLQPEETIPIVKIKKIPLNEIPLPPPIRGEGISAAGIVSTLKARFATPIPVPDFMVDTTNTLASQTFPQPTIDTLSAPIANGSIVIEPEPDASSDPLPTVFIAREMDPIPVMRPMPEYPELARRIALEGFVTVNVLITKEGKVKNALLLKSSDDVFSQPALDAARKWSFTPALMNGKPIAVWVSIPFRFRLAKR